MGGVSNIASAGVNLALAHQAKNKANKNIKRDRDREIADITERMAAQSRERQTALRERIAALRARAGASGVAATGGSIDAVIRGLEREAKDESAFSKRAANQRIGDVRESASGKRRRNLLEFTGTLSGLGRSSRSLLR